MFSHPLPPKLEFLVLDIHPLLWQINADIDDYAPILIHIHIYTHSPLAVAMFDYEAFGEEEDNLEFEEGDLIEVSDTKTSKRGSNCQELLT